MRIAVISDIHGNSAAFRKALDDIRSRKCDKIVCLGDIVGYGYDPRGCIELARNHCDKIVKGNHDAAVSGSLSIDWFSATAMAGVLRDRARVSDSDKEWLTGLDYQHVDKPVDGFYAGFAHGTFSYPSTFEYIHNIVDASLEISSLIMAKINVLFIGHTHETAVYSRMPHDQLAKEYDPTGVIEIDPKQIYIVNVGSVGYPRCQPFTSYSILDVGEDGKATVEFVRLPFDFDEYVTNMRLSKVPIPHWMERWEAHFKNKEKLWA